MRSRRPRRSPCRGTGRRAAVAEGDVARDLVQIVGPERHDMGQRHGVVDVNEGVDLGQPATGEHVLDQPLDRGAVARLLDAEGAIGLPPRGDAGDLRQLHPAHAARQAASRSAISAASSGGRPGSISMPVAVTTATRNSRKSLEISEMSMFMGKTRRGSVPEIGAERSAGNGPGAERRVSSSGSQSAAEPPGVYS